MHLSRQSKRDREQIPTLRWEQSASKQQRQNREKASKCNRREDAAEVEAGRAAWGRGRWTQWLGRRGRAWGAQAHFLGLLVAQEAV